MISSPKQECEVRWMITEDPKHLVSWGSSTFQAGSTRLQNLMSPALVWFTVGFLWDDMTGTKTPQSSFLGYERSWCSFIVCRRLPFPI